MKKLRYILAILFSFLIIISGVGVSVVHYCCAGCEATQSCCSTGCAQCSKTHHSSQDSCEDTGCTAVHYKVDIVKYAPVMSSFTPVAITLFCELLPEFGYLLPEADQMGEVLLYAPPKSVSSRQYLALYSTLLI